MTFTVEEIPDIARTSLNDSEVPTAEVVDVLDR
jgi:hypothetical protein